MARANPRVPGLPTGAFWAPFHCFWRFVTVSGAKVAPGAIWRFVKVGGAFLALSGYLIKTSEYHDVEMQIVT